MLPNRIGKLSEISPFGTGFIEDVVTEACYGFHISMLFQTVRPDNPTKLEGTLVRFSVAADRVVDKVTVVDQIGTNLPVFSGPAN
jgi:hypothetical protein